MPLYYFAKDVAMGDTFGQNVGSVWFVVAADGTTITTAPAGSSTSIAPADSATPASMTYDTPASVASATPAAAAGATVMVANTYALGNFLVGGNGMTLYVYSNDTAGVSNCTGTCATNWPPLLTTGAPSAGMGVTASKLGTITRGDGSVQVTYNNQPLYYFSGDQASGDTTGQGKAGLWNVIAP